MDFRDAEHGDFMAFLELGKNIHHLSPYSCLRFNEKKAFTKFASYLENRKRYFCKLAETKGEVVGIIYARLMPPDYSDELIASDVYFWVSSGYRRMSIASDLIQLFICWSKQNGAKYIQLQNGAGLTDDLSGLFEKAGMKKTGSIYGVSV